jgi:hypothetical protein
MTWITHTARVPVMFVRPTLNRRVAVLLRRAVPCAMTVPAAHITSVCSGVATSAR